jgi:hypothetical protein
MTGDCFSNSFLVEVGDILQTMEQSNIKTYSLYSLILTLAFILIVLIKLYAIIMLNWGFRMSLILSAIELACKLLLIIILFIFIKITVCFILRRPFTNLRGYYEFHLKGIKKKNSLMENSRIIKKDFQNLLRLAKKKQKKIIFTTWMYSEQTLKKRLGDSIKLYKTPTIEKGFIKIIFFLKRRIRGYKIVKTHPIRSFIVDTSLLTDEEIANFVK